VSYKHQPRAMCDITVLYSCIWIMQLFFDGLPTALPCTFHLTLVVRIAHLETRPQINPDFNMRKKINDHFLLYVMYTR